MRTHGAIRTALFLVSAAVLAACSSSGGVATGQSPPASASAPIAAPVTAPSGSPSSSPTDSASPGADDSRPVCPVAADPCDVVTLEEASALVGKPLKGKEEEATGSAGTGKRCTYGSMTTDVVWVQIAQAATAADAQADWDKEQAIVNAAIAKAIPGKVKPPSVGSVSGVGDRAAAAIWSANVAGHTISLSAIYVLDGPTFLAFGDTELDHAPASIQSLKDQATTSLSRLEASAVRRRAMWPGRPR